MKPRHLVTLLVVGVPLVLLAGVLWRLNEAGASDGAGDDAAPADSLNEVLGASAVEAFPTEISLPVEGAMVRRDTFVLWVEAQGRAVPLRSAPLQAEVSGPVISVPVQEGARVS